MSQYQIVEVVWLDTRVCSDEVHNLDEALDEGVVFAETSGYLLEETDEYVKINTTIFDGEVFRSLWTIPKGCIKSIRRLK